MRWMLLPLLLASAAGAVEPPRPETPGLETPRLEADSGIHLVLTGLPPILADEEVKKHLTTGLTTTLQFRVGGNKPAGGARVEIRYDLWDEVFLAKAGGLDGRVEHYRASSLDELIEWWTSLRLTVLDTSTLIRPPATRLRVTADVVPFSQAEQDDTQRWFSESIDEASRSDTEAVGRAGEDSAETLRQTFNLLLATSIRRHAVVSYPWMVTVPGHGSPPEERP